MNTAGRNNGALASVLAGLLLAALAAAQGAWPAMAVVLLLAFACLALFTASEILRLGWAWGVLAVVAAVNGLSFLHDAFLAEAGWALGVVCLASGVAQRRRFSGWLASGAVRVRNMPVLTLLALFVLGLAIVLGGMYIGCGYYTADYNHPIYSLGIGRAFGAGGFSPPDLAYAGKDVVYHFLSTRQPLLFGRALGLDMLTAVYIATPMFLAPLLIVAVARVMEDYPDLAAPLWLVLLLPFFGLGLLSPVDLFKQAVSAMPSYPQGQLLMVLCLHALAGRRMGRLAIAGLMGLFTKGSSLLTVIGGTGLLALRSPRDARLWLGLAVLAGMFVAAFGGYYAGAYSHNLWALFPGPVFFGLLKAGSAWMGWVTLGLNVLYGLIALAVFFRSESGSGLATAAALGFSGWLGTFLLTELSEANSFQFLMSAMVPLGLAVIAFFRRLGSRVRWLYWPVRTAAAAAALLCVFVLAKDYGLQAFRTSLEFERLPLAGDLHYRLYERLVPQEGFDRLCRADYPMDLVEAYTWLETRADGVVLFGRHYEMHHRVRRWWPSTGFIRSALSGQQMYIENFKYRGIFQEKDYAERFADTVYFYEHYVRSSRLSAQRLAFFRGERFGKAGGVPLSKSDEPMAAWLHKASGGKEWYAQNLARNVEFEIRLALNRLEAQAPTKRWLTDFLKSNGVRYIVLELGDHAGEMLQGLTAKVYENASVTILQVQRPSS